MCNIAANYEYILSGTVCMIDKEGYLSVKNHPHLQARVKLKEKNATRLLLSNSLFLKLLLYKNNLRRREKDVWCGMNMNIHGFLCDPASFCLHKKQSPSNGIKNYKNNGGGKSRGVKNGSNINIISFFASS